MPVSLDTKVDLLIKKLSGVAKTDTLAAKSPSNESIPSPSLNRGDTIWLNSYLIPPTANATLGTLESYFQTNSIQCIPDQNSVRVNNVYPTWKTGLIDWIPPEFDAVNNNNTYRVKVFFGPPNLVDPQANGAIQIYADGALLAGEWNFDYQAGILNFFGNTPIPVGMDSNHVIYIQGWRYVGPKGFNSVFKVDTPVMRGDILLPTLITLKGDIVVEENAVIKKDLEIQGADLTTNQTVFNLLNTTATTINFGGNATTIEIGASTGTTNINNNLEVDGDVVIDGDELKTTSTTFNLIPDAATTVNFAQAATSIILGATTGTTNIRNDLDVDGDLNVDGSFHIGEDLDVDGDLNIDGGDLTVSTTTFNLANEVATTVNFAGDATVVEIGSTTGTTSVNNNLDVDLDMHIGQNLDVDGDVNIDGGDLTVSTETFNLANETAKNVNFAGEATNIEIGSQEGVTNVNNNLIVDGNTTFGNRLTVDGIVDVNNSLYVEGQARVNQSLEVEDSVKVQNELAVEGDTQITKDLNVGGYIKAGKLVDTMIDCGEY